MGRKELAWLQALNASKMLTWRQGPHTHIGDCAEQQREKSMWNGGGHVTDPNRASTGRLANGTGDRTQLWARAYFEAGQCAGSSQAGAAGTVGAVIVHVVTLVKAGTAYEACDLVLATHGSTFAAVQSKGKGTYRTVRGVLIPERSTWREEESCRRFDGDCEVHYTMYARCVVRPPLSSTIASALCPSALGPPDGLSSDTTAEADSASGGGEPHVLTPAYLLLSSVGLSRRIPITDLQSSATPSASSLRAHLAAPSKAGNSQGAQGGPPLSPSTGVPLSIFAHYQLALCTFVPSSTGLSSAWFAQWLRHHAQLANGRLHTFVYSWDGHAPLSNLSSGWKSGVSLISLQSQQSIKSWYRHQVLAMKDCFARSQSVRMPWTAFIDTDEFIAPGHTLPKRPDDRAVTCEDSGFIVLASHKIQLTQPHRGLRQPAGSAHHIAPNCTWSQHRMFSHNKYMLAYGVGQPGSIHLPPQQYQNSAHAPRAICAANNAGGTRNNLLLPLLHVRYDSKPSTRLLRRKARPHQGGARGNEIPPWCLTSLLQRPLGDSS